MNKVKVRRYKTPYGMDQVSLTVPTEIEVNMPKHKEMSVHYNEETGILEYIPIVEE